MTLKKSKSNLKKTSKIVEYKNIQQDIIDYAGRHHFHQVISNMLYAVYNEKSEDPYTFMINYLIEKKGSKSVNYGDQKLLIKIQEKDEEIKRLTERVAYLESLNNGQASELIGSTTFKNNVSLATTLSDLSGLSVSDLEKFAENPSFLNGFPSTLNLPAQKATTSDDNKDFNMENPMTSESDVTVLVPTNDNPNDLILAFNFSRLTKTEPLENNFSTEEMVKSEEMDEIAMEVSEPECIDKTVKVNVSERNATPENNFDDFEPDYEPDDD